MGKRTKKNQNSSGPKMIDPQVYIMAGLDPKTGKPIRATGWDSAQRQNIKDALNVIDEAAAVNRYRWIRLPAGITSQEVERLVYHRFTLVFFYYEELEKFFFMPYALDGTIDFYGRYNTVHPVPYAYGDEKELKKQQWYKDREKVLSQIKLTVVRDPVGGEEDKALKGVILYDYTPRINPNYDTPRSKLQSGILDFETDIIFYLKTSMMTSTGVKGVRVNDADEQIAVEGAANSIHDAATNGKGFIPILGHIDFQDLGSKGSSTFQEYTMVLQSMDNLRLSFMGLENGGIFEKKAHKLQDEQDMNEGQPSLVLNDGLAIRQNFCLIANSIWGLDMWCEEEPTERISDEGEEEPEEEDGDDGLPDNQPE